ncbi:MAG: CHAT domain-containing protein [Saprospiraceae bacterium]|nr:CHAT domain-containing protein [Saprospiraceae bacterium]
MQKSLLLVLCLVPCFLTAQTVDSVALRQVDSLVQASKALTNKRDFTQAFEVNRQAETIALEKFGRESTAYASCCYNHGRNSINSRNTEDGMKWLYEALAIQEKVLGKTHFDCGKTMYLIAFGYLQWSQHEKALPYALASKDIVENTEGKRSSFYMGNLNNAAICYAILGQQDEAEAMFLESRELNGQINGKESLDYLRVTSNLSHFYVRMGDYQKALQFALEATELSSNLKGDDEPVYAFCVKNLASAYTRLDDYQKAEPLYQQALSIFEKAYGKEDLEYLDCLHDLATLYSRAKQHQKSVELFLEVLAQKEKTVGKNNWSYSFSANGLGVSYMEMGEFEKAEPLLLSANETDRSLFGTTNAEVLFTMNNLATLYSAVGKYEKSEALHLEISYNFQVMMANALHHLSEKEIRDYLDKFSLFQDCALSLAQVSYQAMPSNSELSGACFNNALYFKGFMLSTAARARNALAANPANAEDVNLLKSIQRRLGDAYSTPVAERDSALVASLEIQANDLEKGLARSIAGYADAIRSVRWQDVQQHLQPSDVAVEFVRFAYYNKSAQECTDSIFYAALILQPGSVQPLFIPLFEEKQLAALLQTDGKPQPAFYNDLYAEGKTGDQLYDLIWKPVVAALPEGATIYCSPSGLLHRINLAAIPTPDGKTLAEKNRLTTLGSTRQLVVPSPVFAANQNATAQLYGGIQYDVTPFVAGNTEANHNDLAARRGPDFAQNDTTLRGENWNYLRWTEVEISAAAEIMNGTGMAVTVKKGADATEESFKEMGEGGPSPRILHVATHGFFFPDPQGEQAGNEKTFKVSENPMIRSGLVLAGGNYAWKNGKPLRPDLEDGILTAYEISQMNLSNTELAVLSACETGLGDLVGNEGVYGLQRAFKIAGVRYLIMSLWQVPDYQTQVFMSAFYKHWLDGKMPVPEAFRATQSELKAKYGDAFKWAGFVLVE